MEKVENKGRFVVFLQLPAQGKSIDNVASQTNKTEGEEEKIFLSEL